MLLYHGSDKYFDEPDLSKCKNGKDFGKGFYLTRDRHQAIKWATRNKGRKGYLYTYEIRESLLTDYAKYNIKVLTQYNKEWLDFITDSRYKRKDNNYDFVYDKMADNVSQEISNTLELYYLGKLSVFQALAIIRDKNIDHSQYCFRSQEIIKNELHKRGEKPEEVSR